ncbi:MAG: hypothetical protein GC160_07495 [Acidobacteria bacterium]|nr:hypothetical protein [Acidobacteriota bacterium]
MKLSNFLRWGGRKETRPESESSSPFWGRKDRRRAGRRVLAGEGWLLWLDESGELQRERAQYVDSSEQAENALGLGAIVRRPTPIGPHCWTLSDDGPSYPCVVKHCEPCDEGFRVGGRLDPEVQEVEGWGAARVKWLTPEETLMACPSSIRNATEGLIEVNVALKPPSDVLLLLEGKDYACLCALRKVAPYGDRYLLEVEPVGEATPVTREEEAA